jgi:hypothetical protein
MQYSTHKDERERERERERDEYEVFKPLKT